MIGKFTLEIFKAFLKLFVRRRRSLTIGDILVNFRELLSQLINSDLGMLLISNIVFIYCLIYGILYDYLAIHFLLELLAFDRVFNQIALGIDE